MLTYRETNRIKIAVLLATIDVCNEIPVEYSRLGDNAAHVAGNELHDRKLRGTSSPNPVTSTYPRNPVSCYLRSRDNVEERNQRKPHQFDIRSSLTSML